MSEKQTEAVPLMGRFAPGEQVDGYIRGAWDEVRAAFMAGHISEAAYESLRTALPAGESRSSGTPRDSATVTDAAVNDMARLLIAEWERVEGPVTASYVANFADMARVVLAALPHLVDTDTAHTIEQLEGEVARLRGWNEFANRRLIDLDAATEKYDALVASVRELAEQIENLREFDAFIEKDGDWLARQLRALLPDAVDAEEGKR